MKKTNTPTIYDVAKHSGVSPATVSRVINHQETVSKTTLNKVISSMKQLNFPFEEVIKTKEINKGFIIVNLPSLANPFYNDIINSIKISATRFGHMILIITENFTHANQEKLESLAKMPSTKGFITLGKNESATLHKINKIVPVIQCCDCDEDIDISSVTIDDVTATNNVMEHLISLGKKRIAFINGPMHYKYAQNRLRGYEYSLKKNGLEYHSEFIISLDIDYNAAFSAAMQLLTQDILPDAIFTSSDVFASAVIRAAYQTHLRIPQDIMVTGFDNIDFTTTSIPSITTINQPRYQLGYSACELLFEQIHNSNTSIKHITLDTELIIRESTQC